jgi:GAF domain-containing protein
VVSDRMTALIARMTTDGGLTTPLAGSAAALLGATGISASITSQNGDIETAWSADATSVTLQDLQFTLGEGPSIDAARLGALTLVPDLDAPPALRWPMFSAAAAATGVRALFAFPLRIGAIGLGTMEVYRVEPGRLKADVLADALGLADAVTNLLLRLPLDTESFLPRAAVHQATGMVAVQLRMGLADALVRLRAHAFGSNRSINDVAADVVARRLDFTGQE